MIARLSPDELLARLQALLTTAPPFVFEEPIGDEEQKWLDRSEATLELGGFVGEIVQFRTARQMLNTFNHDRASVISPLRKAYYKLEMSSPKSVQGQFIPPGDEWGGFAAIIKLLEKPRRFALFVDPYLDSSVYFNILPHVAAATVGLLATTRGESREALTATHAKWIDTHDSKKQLVELRFAPKKSLHDRLIILDDAEAYSVSQSFKDIAKKSAASVSRLDAETSALKKAHYGDLWRQASEVP